MNDREWEFDDSIQNLENFANSEMVKNQRVFDHFIEKSFNSTFYMEKFYEEMEVSINPDDMETLHEDLPTIVILGSYTKPKQFISMTYFTYDYELEEDESIHVTAEKLKKNLFRLKGIIEDMDFCMISYPMVASDNEFTKDCIYEYGLETIVFNAKGIVGGALSKRARNHECNECNNCYNFQVQYLIDENGSNISHKDVRKFAHKKNIVEAFTYSEIVESFYKLPKITSESSLNDLVNDIKKDKIKIFTTKDTIQDELKNKVMSLPLDGFVLFDHEVKETKEQIAETMKLLLANANADDESYTLAVDYVNQILEEEE